jgi:hypothetical protein
MKLAQKILEHYGEAVSVEAKQNEAMRSSDSINVELGDGHLVSVNYNFEIFQRRDDGDEFIPFDDIEKQAMVKALLKFDADTFMRAAASKLDSLQKL